MSAERDFQGLEPQGVTGVQGRQESRLEADGQGGKGQFGCTQPCYEKKLGPTQRSHCTSCHEFFNSDYVFDRHRVGEFGSVSNPRRCLSVAQMQKKGWALNKDGFWVSEPMVSGAAWVS